MRKKALFAAFIIISCSFSAFSQLNRTIHDEKTGKDILYGYCTRQALENHGDGWFKAEYESYMVKTETFNFELPEKFDSVQVFMGTWESNSRREVPRFCKIFDLDYFKDIPVTFICLDSKITVDVLNVDDYYVQFLPAIVFYKKGEELCRFLEQPRTESMESDIMDLMERMQ